MFTCTCGSVVRFDKLSRSWPIHACPPPIKAFRRERRKDGSIAAWINEDGSIIATREAETPRFEESLLDDWSAATSKRDHPIQRRSALKDEVARFEGVVREVHRDVDVYADLEVPRTAIGRAALGLLGIPTALMRLTVHAGSLIDGALQSYSFYVDQALADREELKRDSFVYVELIGVGTLGRPTRWMATSVVLVA